jgi:putative ABC transport system permease protein
LLIAACGGAAGLLLATVALPPLSRMVRAAGIEPQATIEIHSGALVIAVAMAVIASIMFGLAPAIHAVRFDAMRALAGGSRATAPPRKRHWRTAIIATQVAVAFPVLCATLALVDSFTALQSAAATYQPEYLMLAVPRPLGLQTPRYRTVEARGRLWRELDAAVETVPGVITTAMTAPLALNREAAATMVQPVNGSGTAQWQAQLRCASPDFFSTMNMAIARGRAFDDSGDNARARVAVVNRSFARAYFADANPIGQRVRVPDPPPVCPAGNAPLEIVGIVENSQLPDVSTGNRQSPPTLYVSTHIATPRSAQFLVRTSLPAVSLRRDIQRAIAGVDPELVGRTRSLQEDLEGAWMPMPRLLVRIALSSAAIALLLVIVGTFGVLSYSVSLVNREIGIRIALGASRRFIAQKVLGQGLGWVTLGAAAGSVASLLLEKFVRSHVWGIAGFDLGLLAAAAAVVLMSAAAACWLPARRAMRVDPVIVLRQE